MERIPASHTAGPEVLIIVLFLFFLWSVVYSYTDAVQRGKSGCLVALLVALLSWPIGLIVWLVFRPEKVVSHNRTRRGIDSQNSSYKASGFPMLTCEKCGGPVKLTNEGIFCPSCSTMKEYDE
jgi:hypothetical protein